MYSVILIMLQIPQEVLYLPIVPPDLSFVLNQEHIKTVKNYSPPNVVILLLAHEMLYL